MGLSEIWLHAETILKVPSDKRKERNKARNAEKRAVKCMGGLFMKGAD